MQRSQYLRMALALFVLGALINDAFAGLCPADTSCTNYEWDAELRKCIAYPTYNVCNDGNPCTYGDRCVNGGCRGTPITCTSSVCAIRTCNGTSTCSVAAASAGTLCTDADSCTYGSTCDGVNTYCGTKISCVSDACATRQCNDTPNCTESLAPPGTRCDDGSACSADDHCDGAGVCVAHVCPARPCEMGVCDPATHVCVYALLPANTACPNATNPCELVCDGTSAYCQPE